MPKLKIDGMEIEVEQGMSILQACEQLGIEVPRFCYHDRLSVPANCRMCLVDMENSPKPVASCAMPCGEGMIIHTKSERAKKARKGVMEFLLINHPLDCPICDQGGECDLQDQAMAYGYDESRYSEPKRAVEEKDFGPLIKTFMTRCIHCTRCVRFSEEIAGTNELGATYRGEHMEIGTYVEKAISSELSGNMIDICPVGALTSKPYAFRARSWELRKCETVDVMDAVGSNIRMDVRGGEVMRILPSLNEDINEGWISDKTRFVYDGLKNQRLDQPYVRRKGKLEPVSWEEALAFAAKKLKGFDGKEIAALAGDLADVESMYVLKDLMSELGSTHLECRVDGAQFDVSEPSGYLFNTSIAGIEKADAILLVGTDPRHEATLINARIRKRYLQTDLKVALIGEEVDLTYPVKHLGSDVQMLDEVLSGKNAFSKVLKDAQNPMIIVGMGALQRDDAKAIQHKCAEIAQKYKMIRDDFNGFNVLQTAASRVGALEIGFVPKQKARSLEDLLSDCASGKIKAVYLLGADEVDMSKLKDCFVIYQGHHGDAGAMIADVILPGCAYSEKRGTYVNCEGRVQQTRRAVFPVGEAKEDWRIIRALSQALDMPLAYDDEHELWAALTKSYPLFAEMNRLKKRPMKDFGAEGKMLKKPFTLPIQNYYMTNVICRASKTMADCVKSFLMEDANDKAA